MIFTPRKFLPLFVALIALFSFVPTSIMAQEIALAPLPTIIAVVDIDKILLKSKAAISVQKQVDSKRKGFLSEVKKAEDSLREEQKSIESSRETLSKEDLLKRVQGFEKGRLTAQKSIQERKAALDKAYSKAMSILTKSIYDVCQEIADERKIDLVITRQNIIVGNMSLDITKDVMEKMDKKLPKLMLDVK